MRTIFFILALLAVYGANAQVANTSYVTASGEKVLRLELMLPVDKKEAWTLFTSDAQLAKWVAPVVHMELRNGGYMLTNYDKNKSLSDSTSIKLKVTNYLQHELLTFKVKPNNFFPRKTRDEDGDLQELIQFVDGGEGKTKIISSMVGWGRGEEWNKVYDFFVKGNTWTYEQLLKLYQK